MRTTFYVTVNRRGAARLTKRLPDVYAGEISTKVNLSIPDEAFRSPFAEASIEVPEGYVIKPEIEAWLDPVEEGE